MSSARDPASAGCRWRGADLLFEPTQARVVRAQRACRLQRTAGIVRTLLRNPLLAKIDTMNGRGGVGHTLEEQISDLMKGMGR